MKIYFACSITGGRDYEEYYQMIVNSLHNLGHSVPTAILASSDVVQLEDVVNAKDVFSRDTQWIEESDLVVAEVSTPSHGVGYEIGLGLSQSKPVFCLFREGVKVSKMLLGNPDVNLKIQSYRTLDDIDAYIQEFLEE